MTAAEPPGGITLELKPGAFAPHVTLAAEDGAVLYEGTELPTTPVVGDIIEMPWPPLAIDVFIVVGRRILFHAHSPHTVMCTVERYDG